MMLPHGAAVVPDSSARGGKAVRFSSNSAATTSFSLPSGVNEMSVTAKGGNCGGWPQMQLSIDGAALPTINVNSTSWSTYPISVKLEAGKHSLAIAERNWRTMQSCNRYLYVNNVNFSAIPVTPAPPPSSSYDPTVLADHPVAFWDMNSHNGVENDRTGNGHPGTYSSAPQTAGMPNGDHAADFSGQYMTVASSPVFSISTTKQLTWEAWIRPDVLQWPEASDPSSLGYVDWISKCQNYSPSCEWEGRMYSSAGPRCSRLSAYVFNPSAGKGSGADWQPACGLFQDGQWLHVVGEYQTQDTPPSCDPAYPGTIDIWVNAVEWNSSYHRPTGCMSQYGISPTPGGSPVNIGAMALDTLFPGAVGKVAIYDYLLSPEQITAHFTTMTGQQPSWSCADTCTMP
jgi:Concanavalin A-like lectin/glucanases superfamily/Ca-dependent carbohydrate-binding module xylan-binding